ncbi:sugar ABC transporter permease [Vagococcus sp. BWB3-3]|uniref:Sugar ABC transporter permease n=1 Tax=Vagococcus allomyrinae TaxID=2794353 RepID=A0A940SUD2_9ENTE|nr:sugar ABC transporter permease [Vagococcus allomyrinae]MBP1040649.1 sugar ABC transporter permease [Vagococcus allomyrinae]
MTTKNRQRQTRRFVIICLAPAIILFTIFMIIPTVNVFYMSLFKWGGYSASKTFVGLANFKILAKDLNFFRSFQNSIVLIVLVTLITMVFAIGFAAILSREKLKGQNFFRVIFYVPNILSVVVIAAIFSAIYDPKTGLLNSFLKLINLEKVTQLWLGDQKIVIYSLAGAMIWQAIGYYMVMYMASMAAIPESLYEASALEGAGRIKQFTSVTLPLIWNNIRTTLTFFIISSINLSFLFVKTMTGGGPDGATEVFLSYMYKQAYTNSSYGYGMAIGVVVFIFSFALSAIVNRITKREIYEY